MPRVGPPYNDGPREEPCANCESWSWNCGCESCKSCRTPHYWDELKSGYCEDYCEPCRECSCETTDTHELECRIDDCQFCISKHERKYSNGL